MHLIYSFVSKCTGKSNGSKVRVSDWYKSMNHRMFPLMPFKVEKWLFALLWPHVAEKMISLDMSEAANTWA